jgi:hypothetical protein
VQEAQDRLGFGTQLIAEFQYRIWTHQIPQDLWMQSASFPGSEDDFNTLFVLTNSLAHFAAKAAYSKKRKKEKNMT